MEDKRCRLKHMDKNVAPISRSLPSERSEDLLPARGWSVKYNTQKEIAVTAD